MATMDTEGYVYLRSKLEEFFKYPSFRNDLQYNALFHIIYEKDDLVISMPSGYGKTICYQLPALLSSPRVTVVFSPSVIRIKSKIHEFQQYGNYFVIETINSETSESEQKRIEEIYSNENYNSPIIYVTPDQIDNIFFMNFLTNLVKRRFLARVVVDKAHHISEIATMGDTVDYMKLTSLRKMFFKIPWITITASDNPKIVENIISALSLKNETPLIQAPCYRKNVFYNTALIDKPSNNYYYVLLQFFPSNTMDKNYRSYLSDKSGGIIYCKTEKITEEISMYLYRNNISVAFCHPGMNRRNLIQIQSMFSSGELQVIVVTNDLEIEINRLSIRFVIHWGMPNDMKKYYQDTCMVGKDGLHSVCCIYDLKEEEFPSPFQSILRFMSTETCPQTSYSTILKFLQFFENASYVQCESLLHCFNLKKQSAYHMESNRLAVTNIPVQLSVSNEQSHPEKINVSDNHGLASSSNEITMVEILHDGDNTNIIRENADNLKLTKEENHFKKKIHFLNKTIEKLDRLFNHSKIKNPPKEVIGLLHNYRVRYDLLEYMIVCWKKSHPEYVCMEEYVNVIDFSRIENMVYEVTGCLSDEGKYRMIIFKIVSYADKNPTEKEILDIIKRKVETPNTSEEPDDNLDNLEPAQGEVNHLNQDQNCHTVLKESFQSPQLSEN